MNKIMILYDIKKRLDSVQMSVFLIVNDASTKKKRMLTLPIRKYLKSCALKIKAHIAV